MGNNNTGTAGTSQDEQRRVLGLLRSLLDDDRITAIGLHIEGVNDVAEFDRVARRALEKKVPVVALKSGKSAAAAEIAMSHTSSLTGSDALFDALFQRTGIERVENVPQFLETLKLLAILGPLSGNRVASMSCSGEFARSSGTVAMPMLTVMGMRLPS